jgi:hypothetical protein
MKKRNAPTAEQIAEFQTYLAEFQNLLNLRDWRIEHSGKPASKGALAMVGVSLEDRLAVWSMGADWGNMPITPKTLRETALHEVLHVFLAPLLEAAASRDEQATASLEHSAIVVLEKLLSK